MTMAPRTMECLLACYQFTVERAQSLQVSLVPPQRTLQSQCQPQDVRVRRQVWEVTHLAFPWRGFQPFVALERLQFPSHLYNW